MALPLVASDSASYDRAVYWKYSAAVQAVLMSRFESTYKHFCALTRVGGGDPQRIRLYWSNVEDVESGPRLCMEDIEEFVNAVRHCLSKPNVQILGFIMTIRIVHECGHANAIIYDKQTNTVERWEPHGIYGLAECDPTGMLDKQLEWFFRSLFGWKFERPQASCPRLPNAPQRGKVQGSFQGDMFCFSWSILYLETRLMNPDHTGVQVSKALSILASQDKGTALSAETIIRRYAFVIKTAWKKYGKHHSSPANCRPVTRERIEQALRGGQI